MSDDAQQKQRKLNEDLWKACEKGDLEKVKELKEAGGDVNWIHPQEPAGRAYQFTCMHIASDQKHLDVVKYLVDKGNADLDKKSPYGETALQHVDGLKGAEEVRAFLKMRVTMKAVLAAQKFKSMQAKTTGAKAD